MDCKNVLYLIKQNFILEKIKISESIKINVLSFIRSFCI